jgi:hypothetical protein
MAKFKAGNPGRTKGTQNKMTREIRAVIGEMVDYLGDPVTLREMMDRLVKDRPEVVMNFLARVAPRDMTFHEDKKPFVIIRFPAKEVEPGMEAPNAS